MWGCDVGTSCFCVQGLKERVHELKAFVEVLTVYCNDPRELAEVRASEAALREQVAGFKTQLQVRGEQVFGAQSRESEVVRASAAALRAHMSGLESQLQVREEEGKEEGARRRGRAADNWKGRGGGKRGR